MRPNFRWKKACSCELVWRSPATFHYLIVGRKKRKKEKMLSNHEPGAAFINLLSSPSAGKLGCENKCYLLDILSCGHKL